METVGRLVASRYAGLNYGMSATAVTKGSDRWAGKYLWHQKSTECCFYVSKYESQV